MFNAKLFTDNYIISALKLFEYEMVQLIIFTYHQNQF